MSYIPTEWKTGDIVTAEKLNKLEEGVASGGGGGGVMVVKCTGTATYSIDSEYGEEIWEIPIDTDLSDIRDYLKNGPAFLSAPILQTTAPYYSYPAEASQMFPFISTGPMPLIGPDAIAARIFMPDNFSFGGLDGSPEVSLSTDSITGESHVFVIKSIS